MRLYRNFALVLQFVLLIVLASIPIRAAGEIDPTFNVGTYQTPGDNLPVPMLVQPDGKVILGFFEYGVTNGRTSQGLTRFNPDWTIDHTFNPPRLASGLIFTLALQSTGKILIRGDFTLPNSPYADIARLNQDGSLDTSFNVISTPLPRDNDRLFVMSDDSFYTGSFYKFTANGVPDETFQYQPFFGPVTAAAGLPDGRVYVSAEVPMSSGFDFLTRHKPDGTRDETYTPVTPSRNVRKMIVQPDGKLLIAGQFTFVNSTPVGGIARINVDGSIDTTFNPGGSGANNASISDMALLPDGKILITGGFDTYNGTTRRRFARLNPDGSLDTTFTYTGPINSVFGGLIQVLPNGRILAFGSLASTSGVRTLFITLNSDGSMGPDLVVNRALPQQVRKTTVQADGKIYVAGEYRWINGYDRRSLARVNPDGSVDATFVPFFSTLSGIPRIHQVLVQPDGKVLVAFNNRYGVARLEANGSQDLSFSIVLPSSSLVYDLALQPDGKIIYVGEVDFGGGTPLFGRLNANGTIDTSFTPPLPNNRIHRVLRQPDGKLIVAGEFTEIGGTPYRRIARYNADGTLDTTFSSPVGAGGNVYDIDLQPDGKILVAGTFFSLNGSSSRDKIGRLNPDGSLDTSFAQTADATVQTVKVQADGKILIGGLFANVGGTPRQRLARLNADGSLDASFTASASALVFDINLQADQKILVAGAFDAVNGFTKLGIARLNNAATARARFDYDGDNKSDISVFRPSENKWYIFRSSDSVISQQTFAIAGDIPAPADYDGDQKTDMAIYRPSQGGWWYLSTADGQPKFAQLGGEAGDVPRPSDFDGDGRADFIIFRPSNSTWYRISSGNGATSTIQFGLAGDKPVTGDFDGDGKSDVAIYRPSSGDWWYQSSINNAQLATHFGISTDIPTPADFDGDGRTDFAVYRPSTGVWYILNSSNGSATIMAFGISEDKPVAADYDGDGKADIAVFRPSTGVWYLMRSTAGFTAMQFGISSDIPTENAFIP